MNELIMLLMSFLNAGVAVYAFNMDRKAAGWANIFASAFNFALFLKFTL